jgi:hypothetical protein
LNYSKGKSLLSQNGNASTFALGILGAFFLETGQSNVNDWIAHPQSLNINKTELLSVSNGLAIECNV